MTEQLIKNILTQELFGKRICESDQEFKIVNYLYDTLLLEKLLYGEPISVPELRKLLRKKIVNFEFIKLDGEVRPAKGTTMMKYIPPKDHPKGIRPSSPKVATFYDLDKDAWRSVSKRSKEIVLKKDKETEKPIVVVKDKPDLKVKPVTRERVSTDPIEQGGTYKYTTNRGTKTEIEILRELPSGLFQVSSPVFRTTFAIHPSRIGDRIDPEDTTPRPEPKPEPPTTAPGELRDEPAPREEPPPAEEPEPTPPEEDEVTVLIPKEEETEDESPETKAPPGDITPEEYFT